MNASPVSRAAAAPQPAERVRDEWGVYDPQMAGLPALMRALDEDQPAPAAAPVATAPRQVEPRSDAPTETDVAPAGAAPTGRTQSGALYTLEAPVICPECEAEIQTLRVLRVLRTQVSFTSTLPRRGYVILCPDCDRILSAELSGLV
jgi:hypothetical protein